jgi:hypothetical protein
MSATSHGRQSWKDSPTAKAIAATISLLLIAGFIGARLRASIYAVKLPSRVLGLAAGWSSSG